MLGVEGQNPMVMTQRGIDAVHKEALMLFIKMSEKEIA
jgi:hypothetical protein